ncbi:MAG: hypothetical protein U0744_11500 [Gemmataceae bacterium]
MNIGEFALWLSPWLLFGVLVAAKIASGGTYDLTSEDKHYDVLGRYIGSTVRKTGSGYVGPNVRLGRIWLVVSFLVFLGMTLYLKWTPWHWSRAAQLRDRLTKAESEGKSDAIGGAKLKTTGDAEYDERYRWGYSAGIRNKPARIRSSGQFGKLSTLLVNDRVSLFLNHNQVIEVHLGDIEILPTYTAAYISAMIPIGMSNNEASSFLWPCPHSSEVVGEWPNQREIWRTRNATITLFERRVVSVSATPQE